MAKNEMFGGDFMNNSEFQKNVKRFKQNFLLSINNFPKITSNSRLMSKEFAEKMEELTSFVKNITVSIPFSKELEEYAKIARESENLTEEEFEKRFNAEYTRNKELGEYGWIPSEHCTPKEINMWHQCLQDSPHEIIDFFEEDNFRVLNDIRDTLSTYYSERPYALYYQNGLAAFDREEYMTAAMYWTILLENRVANLVEFPEKIDGKRVTYKVKYSDKGFAIQKNKTYASSDDFTKKRFLFLNVYPALIAYLNRLFAFGYMPLDLKKECEEEPNYLDRTWLLHGRCCRDTTREDCIQLLNALDVCEFALRDTEDTTSSNADE